MMMYSKGYELRLKDNEMIYNGIAIINDAHEELRKFFPDKNLKNHPKVQTS